MRWSSWLLVIGLCVAAALGLGAFKFSQISNAIARAEAFPEPSETVETFVVTQSTQEPQLTVTGELVPTQSADLKTEVAGRIEAVSFAPGAKVSTGQVLVQLDTAEERAQLAETQAQQDIARLAFERADRLVKRGAGSAEARDQAKAQFDAAVARSQALRAAIQKKTIKAPFDAISGLHRLEPGQYLKAGDTITQLVGASGRLWVDFAVPQEFSALEVGLTVMIQAGEDVLPATIIARDSSVSSLSRNLRLRAELDASQAPLLPGMFMELKVPLGREQQVTLVPATAVRRDALGSAVYVLEEHTSNGRSEMRARKRGVVVARNGDLAGGEDLVVIEQGLKPGELIAANGAFKLRDGILVYPIDADPGVLDRPVGH